MTKTSESAKPAADVNKKEARETVHNSRGRGRSAAEIRKSYADYYEIKKKAADLESRNYQHLVLWPASDKDTNEDKFYNMGGNSAIIYVHEIAKRLKRKATLRIDMDNGNTKFHSGICSILNVVSFDKDMAKIGAKRVEKTKGFEEFMIYKLPREYSKIEIREMLREEQKSVDTLNKVLYSKVVYPDIHRQIIELKKTIPPKIKNIDKTYRGLVGTKMIDTLFNIVRLYSEMAHGDRDEYEAALLMNREADMILAEVSVLMELKLWEISTAARIGAFTVGLKQQLKGKIINKHETD